MALKGTSQDQSKFCFKFLNIYLQIFTLTIINVIWGWGGGYLCTTQIFIFIPWYCKCSPFESVFVSFRCDLEVQVTAVGHIGYVFINFAYFDE